MISGVRGVLEHVGADSMIVGVGGISLRVFVPTSVINRAPPVGQPVQLLTYLNVREDALTLYGFQSPDDLSLFEQLLGVTGVGPKLALTMLSSVSGETLRAAIASEKVENLLPIPGVGRKLAGRLILELRGKLSSPAEAKAETATPVDVEVTEALIGLGYSPADAQVAIQSIASSDTTDLEERIRLALQFFART